MSIENLLKYNLKFNEKVGKVPPNYLSRLEIITQASIDSLNILEVLRIISELEDKVLDLETRLRDTERNIDEHQHPE